MDNITFQYPLWFISLCILAALGYAGLLYFRSKSDADKPRWYSPLLGFIRFLSITIIGIFLLGPLLKSLKIESKRPSLVFLMDNSKSLESWMAKERPDFYSELQGITEPLEDTYEINVYSFGESIRPSSFDSINHSELVSNFEDPVRYISDLYENENLGALIISSDGIYNEGKNPLYSSSSLKVPVYALAVGDTSRRTDLSLKRILYNSVGYLNDQMNIQVDVQAINSSGLSSRLIIEKEGTEGFEVVHSIPFSIEGSQYFKTFPLILDLSDPGVMRFRARVRGVTNEINRSNNTRDIYIDVLDARQKIGILADAPHPDLTSLKQIIESNQNYEAQVFFKEPTAQELAEMDMVILHQIPSFNFNSTRLFNILNERSIPKLFIVGSRTNIGVFNNVQNVLSIKGNGSVNQAQAVLTENFNYFTLSNEFGTLISNYPPLETPFGEYSTSPEAQVLLSQRIGGIDTDYPLLVFSQREGLNSAYMLGTGIWRWKLFDHLENQNFDLISELIDKVMVYTSTKEDKRKFRVEVGNNVYNENQEIELQGELYNSNYELINEPEVFVTITNSRQEEFTYTFSRTDNSYFLNAGRLNPGRYTYSSTLNYNGERLTDSGAFTIRTLQSEQFDLEARHSVLHALIQKHGGEVIYPSDLSTLSGQLADAERSKPVLFQSTQIKPLLDTKYLFFVLAFLLALEWVVRRYFGGL